MLDFTVGRLPYGSEPWREPTRKATRMLVSLFRQLGDDNVKLRENIIAGVREALGEKPSGDMTMMVAIPIPGGDGRSAPEQCLTTAGAFRLILLSENADYGNPVVAENFMAEVQRALDAELAA